jgi:hypothetical protein
LNYNPQSGCDDGSCAFNDSFVITPSDSNPCVCSGGVQFSPSSGLLYSISLFNDDNQLIYSQSNVSGASSISSLCPTVYHAVVTYTDGSIVDDYFEIPAGPETTGDAHKVIVCQEAYPTGFGFDLTPELSTFVEGGTWYAPDNSIIPTSDLSNLNVWTLASGWYTYVTFVNNCPVTTGVYLQTNNLGLTTTYVICDSYEPFSMLEMMQGEPDTIGYWIDEQSNIVSNGLYSPATMDEGMFTYVIDNLEGCVPAIRTLMIIERQQNSAGQSTAFSTCEEGTTIDLFELIAGNPDTGGFWSLPGGSTSSEQTIILEAYPSVSGIYSYIVTSQAPCLTQVSEISIVVGAEGCTDPTAYNYDADAACDDSSCVYSPGCTDAQACNFDDTADINDGSCTYPGCTDPNACNYNATAGCDDSSCVYLSGEISGPQLVFTLQEDVFEFPCDIGCAYQWSVSDIAGTADAAGIILGADDDCEATIAWGNQLGIATVNVAVTCVNGCSNAYSYDVQLDDDTTNSVQETSLNSMLLFPNPTTDHVTLSVSPSLLGSVMRVYGLIGNLIMETTLTHLQFDLNTAAWASGVYRVVLEKDGMRVNEMLVKQ